ncbi:MAG: COG2426 family protein [bacterium JZ-2024 1]
MKEKGWIIVLSLLPVSENRGAIIYGYSAGIPSWENFLFGSLPGLVLVPLLLLALRSLRFSRVFHSLLMKLGENRARKVKLAMEQYGYLGLYFFVAVPFPGTGYYSGCLAAALLDIPFARAVWSIWMGTLTAGLIVLCALEFSWRSFQWLLF